MRENKIKNYMYCHMTPGSAESYMTGLRKLENQIFLKDLDYVVSSANSFSSAENYLIDLERNGVSRDSDLRSCLKEYKKFYDFAASNPGWEDCFTLSKKKPKKMTDRLRSVIVGPYNSGRALNPNIHVKYIHKCRDRHEVPGLADYVNAEAAVIWKNITRYTKDGESMPVPEIFLSDIESKDISLISDVEICQRIKAEAGTGSTLIANRIFSLADGNNPTAIADIKELLQAIKQRNEKKPLEVADMSLAERVSEIIRNDIDETVLGGMYHCGHRYISIYYRTFNAPTTEAFLATVRQVLAHELFHAYHHLKIGRKFNEQDLVGNGTIPDALCSGSRSDRKWVRNHHAQDLDSDLDPFDDDREIDFRNAADVFVRVNSVDLYDEVREALADFYCVMYCLDDLHAAESSVMIKSLRGLAHIRHTAWVNRFDRWVYSHALYFMKKKTGAGWNDKPFKYAVRDYDSFGSLNHFEGVYRETIKGLDCARELLHRGI